MKQDWSISLPSILHGPSCKLMLIPEKEGWKKAWVPQSRLNTKEKKKYLPRVMIVWVFWYCLQDFLELDIHLNLARWYSSRNLFHLYSCPVIYCMRRFEKICLLWWILWIGDLILENENLYSASLFFCKFWCCCRPYCWYVFQLNQFQSESDERPTEECKGLHSLRWLQAWWLANRFVSLKSLRWTIPD